MRSYASLSYDEFEALIGDLLGAVLSFRFERFGRGPDGGIDLRHIDATGQAHIVQCKHYAQSNYSQLRRAVAAEASALKSRNLESASYRLVTSQHLSPANKNALAVELSPWATRDDDILGADDLEQMLDEHPEVERRHMKLWLSSHAQLAHYLTAGTQTRSRVLADEISRALPVYVQGDAYFEAAERLEKEHVLVIAGEPGIGKTTLAHILIAELIATRFEPIDVSADIQEAWDVFDRSCRQVFLYDDFLGRTIVDDLRPNEEVRLLRFMSRVAEEPNTRFVLTTREYILRRVLDLREALARYGLRERRFLLELPSYSRFDRAKMLYNHCWHSKRLTQEAKEALLHDRSYLDIVDHRNFNPRLVEYFTGFQDRGLPAHASGRGFVKFALDTLDRPEEIWRVAFQNEIGPTERAVLQCVGSFPGNAEVGDLEVAFDAWCEAESLPMGPGRFERALRIVTDTFLASTASEDGTVFLSATSPGLLDFLQRELVREPSAARLSCRGSAFFEQLMVLERLARSAGPEFARESEEWVVAARSLMHSPSCRWYRVGRPDGQTGWARQHVSVEERVVSLVEIADGPFWGAAEMLIKEQLEAVVEKWRQGQGDSNGALELARRLEVGIPTSVASLGWQDALKILLVSRQGDTRDWLNLVALNDLLPELFSEDEWADGASIFGSFVDDELDYLESHGESDEELHDLEHCAVAFEVSLDSARLETVREAISERQNYEPDPDDDGDFDREHYRQRMEHAQSEAQRIDDLFSGLVEELR